MIKKKTYPRSRPVNVIRGSFCYCFLFLFCFFYGFTSNNMFHSNKKTYFIAHFCSPGISYRLVEGRAQVGVAGCGWV